MDGWTKLESSLLVYSDHLLKSSDTRSTRIHKTSSRSIHKTSQTLSALSSHLTATHSEAHVCHVLCTIDNHPQTRCVLWLCTRAVGCTSITRCPLLLLLLDASYNITRTYCHAIILDRENEEATTYTKSAFGIIGLFICKLLGAVACVQYKLTYDFINST